MTRNRRSPSSLSRSRPWSAPPWALPLSYLIIGMAAAPMVVGLIENLITALKGIIE